MKSNYFKNISKCFKKTVTSNQKLFSQQKRRIRLTPTLGTRPVETTAEEAVKIIKSNDRVFVHSAGAAPTYLTEAVVKRAGELKNVEFAHLHTEGKSPYADPKFSSSFKINSFFVGKNVREITNEHQSASFVPIFLSDIPKLFRSGTFPIDVALVQVSPPDRHGFCSLGISVDISLQGMISAKKVIAQVNKNMPRTHGDGIVHISSLDYVVKADTPVHEAKLEENDEDSKGVGRNVANLIENGSTLQMGIGTIPNAVLASLTNHEKLGIHTEMMSDGMIDLVEKGVITGSEKKLCPNEIVVGFSVGTRRLYDFVDDNPLVKYNVIDWVNNPAIIAQNDKVVAINSCIEIDLTGQINADSIGGKIFSGIGGQMDFMSGAAWSKGGKPIIAITSTTSQGISRIVPFLKRGAGVVTTRSHAHWVVTEYGAVNLFGKNLYQRARELVKVAHPKHREWLNWCIDKQYWKYWDQTNRFTSQNIENF